MRKHNIFQQNNPENADADVTPVILA